MNRRFLLAGIILLMATGCSSNAAGPKTDATTVTRVTQTKVATPVATATLTPSASVTPSGSPEQKALTDQGKNLAISKNYKDAAVLLLRALEMSPLDPETNLWLFICQKHLEQTKRPETLAVAKRVVQLMPDSGGGKQAQAYIDDFANPIKPTATPSDSPEKSATSGDSPLEQIMTDADGQYQKMTDPSFKEIKANQETAKGEAGKGNFEACIKYLLLNGALLKNSEDSAVSTASATPTPNPDSVNNLRRIKLLEAENQAALGMAYQKTGNEPEARKCLTLVSEDKGSSEEWDGKQEFTDVQELAKKQLADLK